jgi:prevent-host-death family protein
MRARCAGRFLPIACFRLSQWTGWNRLCGYFSTGYRLDSLAISEVAMSAWQIQEAKNKLSELIDRASTEGPQIITRHGVEVAVVMPFAGYKKLTERKRRLGNFFLASPLSESGIIVERDRSDDLRDVGI